MRAKFHSWLQVAVIVLAGCWVFSPVIHGGWLWDDDSYVTQNLMLRSPGGLWQIWFAPTGFNYFPITSTVQWVQWHLWGDDPFGYHWSNILLHIASALLFWRLLRKWGLRYAWLGGLLFAVHPVTVESVAWISEIKNTLSLPPLLLAMCAYVDYDARGARADYLRSAAWFLAAMLCKSTVAMFPVVILLYAWWRHGRIRRSDLGASAAFFAISVALGLVTVWFEHRAMFGFGDIPAPAYGFFPRVAAAGLSVAFYFFKSVFPTGLLVTYPRWPLNPVSAVQFLPWLFLGAILWWLWTRRATRWRHALFGFGCFGINLVPILGFVPMAYDRISWVADHFAYLPLLGLIGLAVGAFGALDDRATAAGPRATAAAWPPRPHLVLWSAAAVAVAALALESRRYAGNFQSSEKLWAYTVERNPDAWVARNNLGIAWSAMPGRLNDAITQYEEALRLNPDYVEAHDNLGIAWSKMPGRLNDAIAQYEKALRLNPDYAEAHNNLGFAWSTMPGRLDDAVAQYKEALRLKPNLAEAHNNLGIAWSTMPGRLNDAVAQYEEALRLNPDYAEAHHNLGIAWSKMPGRLNDAIAQYEEALRLNPDYAEAHNSLGIAWSKMPGRLNDAIAQYEEALRLKPDYAEAHSNLGIAWTKMPGRLNDAIAQYEEALRLNPNIAVAHFNLGTAWSTMPGRLNDAIAQYEEALRLNPDFAEAHFNLAVALLNLHGRSEEAKAHLEAFLRFRPENDLARQILARIRSSQP